MISHMIAICRVWLVIYSISHMLCMTAENVTIYLVFVLHKFHWSASIRFPFDVLHEYFTGEFGAKPTDAHKQLQGYGVPIRLTFN